MRHSPRVPSTWLRRNGTHVLRPANQVRSGVASRTASCTSSRSSAAASAFSNAAMYLIQQGPGLGPARLGDLVGRRAHLRQLGPSPLQRALYRCDCPAEHDGDLGGGELQHVPQHQDGALAGGRYCRLAISASRSRSRAATMAAGSADSRVTSASGTGSSQATSGSAASGGACGSGSDRTGPWQHPPVSPGQGRQAPIGSDPVQPGAYRGPALETAVGAPGPQVRLLDQILGVLDRAEHAVAVREQLPPQRLGVLDERGAILHRSHRPPEEGGELIGDPGTGRRLRFGSERG